jgi:hypothetical protein
MIVYFFFGKQNIAPVILLLKSQSRDCGAYICLIGQVHAGTRQLANNASPVIE